MTDYSLDKGSIWEICYFLNDQTDVDPLTNQVMIDDASRSILQDTFNPPPGLSPAEYSTLFMNHFMKTRQKTRELVNELNQKIYRYSVLVQVGNMECYEDLYKTSQSDRFHSWENENMVKLFMDLTLNYNKDGE
jgi:hypothetical protein